MADSPHPDPAALLAESAALWPGGPLPAAPAGVESTREALHAVAERVVSPARLAATGNEIALRWYPGGFGTPPFRDAAGERVVRVEGTELVDSRDGSERRAPLTSLRSAGAIVDDLVETGELAPDPLAIDPAAAGVLATWFCFATRTVSALHQRASGELDPGWVQLWPEHFDIATELGREDRGVRAAYGASPGDERHPEPYLYVAPWSARPEGELWNAVDFAGAELSYPALAVSGDPVETAAAFFSERVEALAAHPG